MEQEKYTDTIDTQLLDDLVSTINTFVQKKVEKAINQSNVEMCWSGIVKSVDTTTGTASVALPFGSVIEAIPNLSGQTLAANDKVKIYADHMNMADCYIGTAYKK